MKLPLLPIVLVLCFFFAPILFGILFLVGTLIFGGTQVEADHINPIHEGPGIIAVVLPILCMIGFAFLVGGLYKLFIDRRYPKDLTEERPTDDPHRAS